MSNNCYVIVRGGDYEVATQAYYAQTEHAGFHLRDELVAHTKRDWNLYCRVDSPSELCTMSTNVLEEKLIGTRLSLELIWEANRHRVSRIESFDAAYKAAAAAIETMTKELKQ